jgi:cell division protein FtsA
MKDRETVIASLDISASKVCCLISCLPDRQAGMSDRQAGLPQEKGILDILGYGISYHDCLKKGVVSDIKGLSDAISSAVCEAEAVSRKKVQSVFFNISGLHLNGLISHGEVVISDRDNEITRHDVDRVIANAKSIHMPYERDIIYCSRGDFVVDGEGAIANPVGMFGMKLETSMFFITAKISVIDNLKKAVKYSGMGIEDSIISPLAGVEATVADYEKDLGVAFVDIGTDITDILIMHKSKPVFFKSLPIGGDNITKKLAKELSIPEAQAERLKIEELSLDVTEKKQKTISPTGLSKKTISIQNLKKILETEYACIFNLIKKEISNSGYSSCMSSGAVMCGQPVIMDGCIELAESVLKIPVRIGHIMGLGAAPKPLPSHIYSIAVGLLQLGFKNKLSKVSLLKLGPKNWALALSDYAKRLYRDYF